MHATALLTRLRAAAVPATPGLDGHLTTPLGRLTTSRGQMSWSGGHGRIDCGADGLLAVSQNDAPGEVHLSIDDRDTSLRLVLRGSTPDVEHFRRTRRGVTSTVIITPGRPHRVLHLRRFADADRVETVLRQHTDTSGTAVAFVSAMAGRGAFATVNAALETAARRWYPEVIELAERTVAERLDKNDPRHPHLPLGLFLIGELGPRLPRGASAAAYTRALGAH